MNKGGYWQIDWIAMIEREKRQKRIEERISEEKDVAADMNI